MPLFSRSSFRSAKKPPKRRSGSLTNVSTLSESTYSLQDLQLESGPVTLKLGGQELVFDKGEWLIGKQYFSVSCVAQYSVLCMFVNVTIGNVVI